MSRARGEAKQGSRGTGDPQWSGALATLRLNPADDVLRRNPAPVYLARFVSAEQTQNRGNVHAVASFSFTTRWGAALSYLAIVTSRFEEMVEFYGATLAGTLVRGWDRPRSRGRVFEIEGLRLEILDADREPRSLRLQPPDDRFHLVFEVENVDAVHARLPDSAEPPHDTSWNARVLELRDPEALPITFLQWLTAEDPTTG